MVVTHWIQSADFSSRELGVADQASVLRLLREHPWSGELEILRQLEDKGEECCPRGLGVVAGEGEILHFCPSSEDQWEVHHHNTEPRKILGFIPSSRNTSETFSGVSISQVEKLVTQFFQSGSVGISSIL